MKSESLNRRDVFKSGSLLLGAAAIASPAGTFGAAAKPGKFRYCLNMSTIRGLKDAKPQLGIVDEIEVAAKAGYDAVEPWIRKLAEYVEKGGSLKDLGKRIADHGMTVESAIGFASWIVDDEAKRKAGLEEMKRDMDWLAQIGGRRIAAPPAGAYRGDPVAMDAAAERYRKVLELGDASGIVPQVEMWGGNPSIGTVEKAIYIAIKAGHPKACFLGDIYHAYKGGCDFAGLRLLGPQAMQVFHFNDYPADPPIETIKDKDRVYPGDGIAPISDILRGFADVGAHPVLSLELFNETYWARPALENAKTGLRKMKECVAAAFG
ncbi:MAG: sugar phosphate isomerase/epimerase [Verrucomicrobiae bacterium]|nr:sugar phosphate isomerase/epimerase [Verrucomicrobiae bacterium]